MVQRARSCFFSADRLQPTTSDDAGHEGAALAGRPCGRSLVPRVTSFSWPVRPHMAFVVPPPLPDPIRRPSHTARPRASSSSCDFGPLPLACPRLSRPAQHASSFSSSSHALSCAVRAEGSACALVTPRTLTGPNQPVVPVTCAHLIIRLLLSSTPRVSCDEPRGQCPHETCGLRDPVSLFCSQKGQWPWPALWPLAPRPSIT